LGPMPKKWENNWLFVWWISALKEAFQTLGFRMTEIVRMTKMILNLKNRNVGSDIQARQPTSQRGVHLFGLTW
jgi:hypothetical protein